MCCSDPFSRHKGHLGVSILLHKWRFDRLSSMLYTIWTRNFVLLKLVFQNSVQDSLQRSILPHLIQASFWLYPTILVILISSIPVRTLSCMSCWPSFIVTFLAKLAGIRPRLALPFAIDPTIDFTLRFPSAMVNSLSALYFRPVRTSIPALDTLESLEFLYL